MRVLSIDPGTTKSGWVFIQDGVPLKWGWQDNEIIRILARNDGRFEPDVVAIEYMKPRGMPTSADEMTTMYELGRMVADMDRDQIAKVWRTDVKINLCGRVTANDSNIRQALIDRFGGQAVAIGGKKCRACKGKGDVRKPGTRGRRANPMRSSERLPCTACRGVEHDAWGDGYETPKGVLHGLSGHCWSALACGLTYLDQQGVAQ